MFCTECGAEINDKAVVCPKCGVPVVSKSVAVPNYLVAAVLTTLFCCLPCWIFAIVYASQGLFICALASTVGGIQAIVYATQVSSKLAKGDIAGAKTASSGAKWNLIACVILGPLLAFVYSAMGVL